ncbi:MAG: LLM class F420-dependent oxidoreductase [Gammaproteobacteria bacterium]|nr:LLM class F420-dependent oxidoreductase [Gammaproteobacteria bacterium]
MRIHVVFPSVLYRDGADGVERMIRGIEAIGFDGLDMYDHVVMGRSKPSRRRGFYSPNMPILEALMLLPFAAAVTRKITLGTGVLILPQRQPVLVAKQVSTLDTLSGGRVRLGVGVGWQDAEYEALQEDYNDRGRRMDEAIEVLRTLWRDSDASFGGTDYPFESIAMEPKPPQGLNITIWIGGTHPRALQRVAKLGDGWIAQRLKNDPSLDEQVAIIRRLAEANGRDPASIGLQMGLNPGELRRSPDGERRFASLDRMLAQAEAMQAIGFDTFVIDCVPLFQYGRDARFLSRHEGNATRLRWQRQHALHRLGDIEHHPRRTSKIPRGRSLPDRQRYGGGGACRF